MDINSFLETKEITRDECDKYFRLSEQLDVNLMFTKGCPACGDQLNQTSLQGPAWTGCIHCRACKSLLYIYFTDRMSGGLKDTVYVFKDK